jgi:hypothetical protein
MYRIELTPGDVTVYRTVEELAIGIRNGLVTSRSRIYHGASDKWLPIEFHPHYKKALELSVQRTGETRAPAPPAKPERPHRETYSFATPRESRAPIFAPAPSPVPASAPPQERGLIFVPDPPRDSGEEHPPHVHDVEVAPEPDFVPPAAVASPVLELPKISYPEIKPAEEPVAEPAPRSRSRRSLHLASVAVILTAGGYVGLSEFSPSPAAERVLASSVVGRPVVRVSVFDSAGPPAAAPARKQPVAPAPIPKSAPSAARTPITQPALRTPATSTMPPQPASSGFAPALEARAQMSGAAPKSASPVKPPATETDSIPALAAPAPSELDLEVPALAGDSLAPLTKSRSDSAMKRILRAVNGGKDIPQRP